MFRANQLVSRAKWPNQPPTRNRPPTGFVRCLDDFVAAKESAGYKLYSFEDILEVAVLEDGFSVTQFTRNGSLTRAAVGAALAGGVGALVGGMTGRATGQQTDKITLLDLQVTLNDLQVPCHRVNVLTCPQGIQKGSPLYQENAKLAAHWQNLLKVAMHRGKNGSPD